MIERWERTTPAQSPGDMIRAEIPCRNHRDGCQDTTTVEHTPKAVLPKRLLCKRCQHLGAPAERGFTVEHTKDYSEFRGVPLDVDSYGDIAACDIRDNPLLCCIFSGRVQ